MTSLHTQETKFLLRLSFNNLLYYIIAHKPLQGITILQDRHKKGWELPILLLRRRSRTISSHTRTTIIVSGTCRTLILNIAICCTTIITTISGIPTVSIY